MPRIHIMLTDEHLERLDDLADGRPRSLVLQRLIDEAFYAKALEAGEAPDAHAR